MQTNERIYTFYFDGRKIRCKFVRGEMCIVVSSRIIFCGNMEYEKGKKLQVRINKIIDNGCYCSFLPLGCKQFGFMPKNYMLSMIDEHDDFMVSVGDEIFVVINKVTERGFLLSDIETYEKEQDKLRRREEKAIQKQRVENFASEFQPGIIFETEVVRVQNSKVIIQVGNVQGVIKKEDTNWNEIDRLEDLLFEGETINAVYVKYENGELFFSLKLLNEKPYDDNLYELSLSDLLKYAGHDSNVFIGQVKQSGNFAFIENLYSCDINQKGKLLVDPIYGYNLKAVVINMFNEQLIDGEYYKVELTRLIDREKRLERNQLFQFTAEMLCKVDNPYKKDVDNAFKKLTSPAGNVAIAHLLKEVVGNMLAAKDRMFFELVQNADDAASQNGVHIKVKTEGDFLLVSHNGFSFNKDDFDAIVSAANGTKKTDENKTGYKGIGFKTVFKEANRVFIKTGGYQFKFDKSDSRFTDFDSFYFLLNDLKTKEQQQTFISNCVSERNKFNGVEDIPWQLEPIWVDMFPEQLGQGFIKSNVAIALEIGQHKIYEKDGYCQAIEEIIINPKFMLFLRNTNRIDFNKKSVSKTIKDGEIILKNSFDDNRLQHYKIFDYKVNLKNIEERGLGFLQNIIEQNYEGKILDANFVDNVGMVIDNIPSKIALNEFTTISFALPIDKNGDFKPNKTDISIFAFLPTLVKEFDFTVFVNANFLLTPDRQHILGDNPWNYFLMEELAYNLVALAANLCLNETRNALMVLRDKYFDYQTSDVKKLAEHFNSAYKSALESEAFILNHNDELAKQEEIIIDDTGLLEFMGEVQFCELLETNYSLPSQKIDSRILSRPIFTKVIHIDFQYIEDYWFDIVTFNPFRYWFNNATNIQKEQFVKWLIKSKNEFSRVEIFNEIINDLPLFQFGEEYKSYQEIDSSQYIITTEHIEPVTVILSKLGFICSNNVFHDVHPLHKYIELRDEEDLFLQISKSDFSALMADERKTLFFALADFDGVGEAKLKKIALFKNLNDEFKPLGEMVAYRENVPIWLKDYVLCKEDNSTELSDYLIAQENEFESIIQENIEVIKPNTSWADLYNIYKNEWTGQFTRNIIDNNEIDNDVLTIIEESDTNTKEYFLNSINKLELLSTSNYKKDSYEYRVLQLALSVLIEPSAFSSKVYFDGKCIKDISVSDDVICSYIQSGETKKVKLSLARLLPQYQNKSDLIEKIKGLFESQKDLDKFFVTVIKSTDDVYNELNQTLNIPDREFSDWNVDGNAQQYLFSVFYRCNNKNWFNKYLPKINIMNQTDEFVSELITFIFENKIRICDSPFTYHLKEYFKDTCFNNEYIFEHEQILPTIEKWADNEKKKKYLTENGVWTEESNAIQFRKLFLENKPIDFIDKLEANELSLGIQFIASTGGFTRPFKGNNQRENLIQLKCKKLSYLSDDWDEQKMAEKSEEWNTSEYKEWKENHTLSIFLYAGLLPRKLSYNGELLLNYEDEKYDFYYSKDKHRLIVSNLQKLEETLYKVAKEGNSGLNFDDYKFLCWGEDRMSISKNDIEEKDKRIKYLTASIREKDEIIERYRIKFGDLSQKINANEIDDISNSSINRFHQFAQDELNIQNGNLLERDGLSIEEQINAHKEAEQVVRKKLERDGYDCSEWVIVDEDEMPYKKWKSVNQVDNIISPDGKRINLIIKSAKGGYIYLSATDFSFLTSNSNNVLMVWDGRNVHSVAADDIFNKESNVNLIFDTEYTPKHYYAALSKVFQYIKRTTFAVKNPTYNAYDSIKSFGMDSKTEGIQDLFDDNDL